MKKIKNLLVQLIEVLILERKLKIRKLLAPCELRSYVNKYGVDFIEFDNVSADSDKKAPLTTYL